MKGVTTGPLFDAIDDVIEDLTALRLNVSRQHFISTASAFGAVLTAGALIRVERAEALPLLGLVPEIVHVVARSLGLYAAAKAQGVVSTAISKTFANAVMATPAISTASTSLLSRPLSSVANYLSGMVDDISAVGQAANSLPSSARGHLDDALNVLDRSDKMYADLRAGKKALIAKTFMPLFPSSDPSGYQGGKRESTSISVYAVRTDASVGWDILLENNDLRYCRPFDHPYYDGAALMTPTVMALITKAVGAFKAQQKATGAVPKASPLRAFLLEALSAAVGLPTTSVQPTSTSTATALIGSLVGAFKDQRGLAGDAIVHVNEAAALVTSAQRQFRVVEVGGHGIIFKTVANLPDPDNMYQNTSAAKRNPAVHDYLCPSGVANLGNTFPMWSGRASGTVGAAPIAVFVQRNDV